jgi:coproporphyrinogen III oxidase-like Fe-S oxidoreductase
MRGIERREIFVDDHDRSRFLDHFASGRINSPGEARDQRGGPSKISKIVNNVPTVQHLGLGPASHSFLWNRRWWNHHSLDQYLAAINVGNLPIEETEILTMEQLRLEALYLGLRTKKGVFLQDFKNQFDYDLLTEKKKLLLKLEEEGFISIRDGYLYPTQTGLAVADSLSLI